jgi:hypothetical protein
MGGWSSDQGAAGHDWQEFCMVTANCVQSKMKQAAKRTQRQEKLGYIGCRPGVLFQVDLVL